MQQVLLPLLRPDNDCWLFTASLSAIIAKDLRSHQFYPTFRPPFQISWRLSASFLRSDKIINFIFKKSEFTTKTKSILQISYTFSNIIIFNVKKKIEKFNDENLKLIPFQLSFNWKRNFLLKFRIKHITDIFIHYIVCIYSKIYHH